ncbi:E3 ubiquitin-protein ligase herc2 [Allomyces arbusculus]|nr:E3 ubiquitin-protein ligase herc2 [Allomyces arbusculus]
MSGYVCVLLESGALHTRWVDKEVERNSWSELVLPPRIRVVHLTGGVAHLCALTATGQVLAWGSNSVGQLGNGTITFDWVDTPTVVDALDGLCVTKISCGHWHSAALLE